MASSTKSKATFQIEIYCMQCFWKANILKVELSMIKIGELFKKLWSLRSCFHILPPGALTTQGIEGLMKRDVSKHWCTLQWCASRGWFIAHANWTSWGRVTHICVNKLIIIGSDNGLSPGRRQAIIWTNAGISLIRTLGTNSSEILIEIHTSSCKKCNWKCRQQNGGHFVSASMC